MPGEPNQVKWRGVRPIDPAESIPCKVDYAPPAADCEPNQVKWIGIRPTNPAVSIPITLPDGCPKLQDADADTKVDVEESADEDIIRMDVAGVEAFKLNSDGILDLAKQSAMRAYVPAAGQVISHNTYTKVAFSVETYDIQNEFDPVTNYRFTAKKAGRYSVVAHISWIAADDTKAYLVRMYKNDALHTYCRRNSMVGLASMDVSEIMNLAANDYVEIKVFQNSGGDESLGNASYYTFLAIHKLS